MEVLYKFHSKLWNFQDVFKNNINVIHFQKGNRDEGNSLKVILMSTGKFKIYKLTVSSPRIVMKIYCLEIFFSFPVLLYN